MPRATTGIGASISKTRRDITGKAQALTTEPKLQTLAHPELIRVPARQEVGQAILGIPVAKLIQDYLLLIQGEPEREEMRSATPKNAARRITLAREPVS